MPLIALTHRMHQFVLVILLVKVTEDTLSRASIMPISQLDLPGLFWISTAVQKKFSLKQWRMTDALTFHNFITDVSQDCH